MLKMASTRLMAMPRVNVARHHSANTGGKTAAAWSSSAERQARRMFIPGPASATRTMPPRGLRSLAGLTGTGFAKPNTNGAPSAIRAPGNRTVPTG